MVSMKRSEQPMSWLCWAQLQLDAIMSCHVHNFYLHIFLCVIFLSAVYTGNIATQCNTDTRNTRQYQLAVIVTCQSCLCLWYHDNNLLLTPCPSRVKGVFGSFDVLHSCFYYQLSWYRMSQVPTIFSLYI